MELRTCGDEPDPGSPVPPAFRLPSRVPRLRICTSGTHALRGPFSGRIEQGNIGVPLLERPGIVTGVSSHGRTVVVGLPGEAGASFSLPPVLLPPPGGTDRQGRSGPNISSPVRADVDHGGTRCTDARRASPLPGPAWGSADFPGGGWHPLTPFIRFFRFHLVPVDLVAGPTPQPDFRGVRHAPLRRDGSSGTSYRAHLDAGWQECQSPFRCFPAFPGGIPCSFGGIPKVAGSFIPGRRRSFPTPRPTAWRLSRDIVHVGQETTPERDIFPSGPIIGNRFRQRRTS